MPRSYNLLEDQALAKKFKILLFTGGSASRSLTLALSGQGHRLTRAVPAWDSGGSSRIIREQLSILAVGDVRQALMTMAHAEGRAGDIVKICNARISNGVDEAEARQEFLYYANGQHPLLQRMQPGLRDAILNYLKTFMAKIDDGFDFRNGSIGNFILTGAHLAHNGDINTAIFVFRKLCDIEGNVWPSSRQNDLHLSARLNDGRLIERQDQITHLEQALSEIGIASIALSSASGATAVANPAVIQTIAEADLIIFGPGSLYTSILPHLLVDGIAKALAAARCPKVFISNILNCEETIGMTLHKTLQAIATTWQQKNPAAGFPFTHVVANHVLFPFNKTNGDYPYLIDDIREFAGTSIIVDELEDAWQRGQHDGSLLAGELIRIIHDHMQD